MTIQTLYEFIGSCRRLGEVETILLPHDDFDTVWMNVIRNEPWHMHDFQRGEFQCFGCWIRPAYVDFAMAVYKTAGRRSPLDITRYSTDELLCELRARCLQ